MRVALISDIHGNQVALDAVLKDIARVGVERTVCLGDTATLGPSPVPVLETLREHAIDCIEGNHDAFLLEPPLLETYTQAPPIVAAVDWCRAELPDWALTFLRGFVPALDIELGGGTLLQLFHGTPRSHMEDLLATTPAAELDSMLDDPRGTVLAGGHTHIQMLRQHRGTLLVNSGSVGLPFREFVNHGPPTILPHAEYATVEAHPGGVQVTLRRVRLDKDALRSAAAASKNPIAPMLVQAYS